MYIEHDPDCITDFGTQEVIEILERPSWDKIWIEFAHALSARSSCRRLNVACVVVSSDNQRVLALGYNGNARGLPNDCDSEEPGNCGCLHAEQNCVAKLDYNDPAEKVAYLTDSPCKMCAKLLVNAGIRKVVYDREYRKTEGLEVLRSARVLVERYQKA